MAAEHIIYEIVGDGVALADAYHTALINHHEVCLAFAKQHGAVGYRPAHNGSIRSLFFSGDVPENWRKIGRHNGNVECVPRRTNKAGKALDAELEATPPSPNFADIGQHFNWPNSGFVIGGASHGGGFKILYPQFLYVTLPKRRYFLALPREHNDGFVVPDNLVELRQSEYMAAIEDHKMLDKDGE